MQVKPLARFLVDARSTIRGAKRSTVLTTILLVSEDSKLTNECLEIIRQGSARIDEEFVLRLYQAGDRQIKMALARHFVLCNMRPPAFRKIFDEVYGRSDLTSTERSELIWNLEGFLFLNPRQLPIYEHVILELLKSSRVDLRVRALSMVGMLDGLDAPTLTFFALNLKSKNPRLRVNTLAGFYQMIERFDRIDSRLRDFVTSVTFRAQVAEMRRSDPDDVVRHNARSVLRALDRALPHEAPPVRRPARPRPGAQARMPKHRRTDR